MILLISISMLLLLPLTSATFGTASSCSQYLGQSLCNCPAYCRPFVQAQQGFQDQAPCYGGGGGGMSAAGYGYSGYGRGGAIGPSVNYYAGYNGKWSNGWENSDPQGGSYWGPHHTEVDHSMRHRKKFHFDFDSVEPESSEDDRINLETKKPPSPKDLWEAEEVKKTNIKQSKLWGFENEDLPEISSAEVTARPRTLATPPPVQPFPSGTGQGNGASGLGGIGIGGGVGVGGIGVNTGLGISAPGIGSPGGGFGGGGFGNGGLVGVNSGLGIGIPGVGPIGVSSGLGIGK